MLSYANFLSGGWKEIFRSWEKKLTKAMRMHNEEEPALKTFKPADLNIPRHGSERRGVSNSLYGSKGRISSNRLMIVLLRSY